MPNFLRTAVAAMWPNLRCWPISADFPRSTKVVSLYVSGTADVPDERAPQPLLTQNGLLQLATQ